MIPRLPPGRNDLRYVKLANMDNVNKSIVELVDNRGLGWQEVYRLIQAEHPTLSKPAIRGRYYRSSSVHNNSEQKLPVVTLLGIQAGENEADIDNAIERAKEEWKRTSELSTRKESQSLSFDRAPICLVFIADVHAGSPGVDYPRLFEEAEIVSSTPGMYAVLVGDMLDQFVIGNLKNVRFHSRFALTDEWALVKGFLEILAHKIVVSVAGNHDNWSSYLIGVDYYRDILAQIRPDALYDQNDCKFKLHIPGHEWKFRVRHSWRGDSIYNPTHGIERAAKWDQDFDVGIAAHTHKAGLARAFNNAGTMGWAVLCGSYKRIDDYARRLGFPKPNQSTAVPLVFTRRGGVVYFEDLTDAAKYMETAYGD